MTLRPSQEKLIKDRNVKSILKAIFKERKEGKPGITISELSKKTGIERHRLTGILEVLVILGIITVFQIGMMKVITPTDVLRNIMKYVK